MGFMEVFVRHMKSIFRNKALGFRSGGYREMTTAIRAREEAERRAAVRKMKEKQRQIWKQKARNRIGKML